MSEQFALADILVDGLADGRVRITRGSKALDVPVIEAPFHVQVAVHAARFEKGGGSVCVRDAGGKVREF